MKLKDFLSIIQDEEARIELEIDNEKIIITILGGTIIGVVRIY